MLASLLTAQQVMITYKNSDEFLLDGEQGTKPCSKCGRTNSQSLGTFEECRNLYDTVKASGQVKDVVVKKSVTRSTPALSWTALTTIWTGERRRAETLVYSSHECGTSLLLRRF